MGKIKIELTREEYRNLLKLVYLGHWVANSHRDEPIAELDETENLIYSYAKNFDSTDIIDIDSKLERYYPSFDFETEMDPYIQEYDEYTFWDELAWRLTDRDFDNKYDPAQALVMTTEEILRKKDAMVEKYLEEFDHNGLENIELRKK
jgi:hypothetical protein